MRLKTFMTYPLATLAATLCGALLAAGCDSNTPPPATKSQFSALAQSQQEIDALPARGTCSLENIVTISDNSTNFGATNNYVVAKDRAYKLIGFATDLKQQTVPKTVRMALAGSKSYALSGETGWERPDVATYFKLPGLGEAGYQFDAAFDQVKAGEYRVFILHEDGSGLIACPTHQTITVHS